MSMTSNLPQQTDWDMVKRAVAESWSEIEPADLEQVDDVQQVVGLIQHQYGLPADIAIRQIVAVGWPQV